MQTRHETINTSPHDHAVSQLHMDDENEPLVAPCKHEHMQHTHAYKCGRCCGMMCDTKYEWCAQKDLCPPGYSPYKACQICSGCHTSAGLATMVVSSIGWCSAQSYTPACSCACVCVPSVPCYIAGFWVTLMFMGTATLFATCCCGAQVCNREIHRCDGRCPRFVNGFKSYAQE